MKVGKLSILRTGRLYPPVIGKILIIFEIYSINIYLAGNHTFEYRDYEHEKFPPSIEERQAQPERQYTESFRISHYVL
jgi:hypothetical protein